LLHKRDINVGLWVRQACDTRAILAGLSRPLVCHDPHGKAIQRQPMMKTSPFGWWLMKSWFTCTTNWGCLNSAVSVMYWRCDASVNAGFYV